jgi:hypothetical protein
MSRQLVIESALIRYFHDYLRGGRTIGPTPELLAELAMNIDMHLAPEPEPRPPVWGIRAEVIEANLPGLDLRVRAGARLTVGLPRRRTLVILVGGTA